MSRPTLAVAQKQEAGPERSAVPDIVRELRRVVSVLAALLLAAMLIAGAAVIVPTLDGWGGGVQYVSTEEINLGGRVVQWDVHLVIRGEDVSASVLSEREAVRLRDAAR